MLEPRQAISCLPIIHYSLFIVNYYMKFIVIEGIDGVGKSTVARLVVETLIQQKQKAHLTSEPSKGPIGVLLRKLLSGEIEAPPVFEQYQAGPALVSLPHLFAADRLEHIAFEVEPRLARGEIVVSDRYYHSSLAYQAFAADVSDVLMLNSRARKPDITFILEASPDVITARRISRHGPKEIYDDVSMQLRLASAYRELPKFLPNERIEYVNASNDPKEVSEEILRRMSL
jgi:dTMP kinase